MKAMKWSRSHTDIYTYHKPKRVWIKVSCQMQKSMHCTAPRTLPRGTKFSYNVNPTPALEQREERTLARL